MAHALRGEGFDASEDGTGRGTPLVFMTLNGKGGAGRMDGESETFITQECSPTLRAKANTSNRLDTMARVADGLTSSWHKSNGATAGNNQGMINPIINRSGVRRLTPIECERLQGFPDNYTRIPWRGKPEEQCPDGPRYKAIGNSMAVNVMRWIGNRIDNAQTT